MKYLIFLMIIFFACESNLETSRQENIDFSIQYRDGDNSLNPGEIDRNGVFINIDGPERPKKKQWVKYKFENNGGYNLASWIIQYYDKGSKKWNNIPIQRSYAYLSGNDLKVKFASSNIDYKVIAAYRIPNTYKYSFRFKAKKIRAK